MLVCVGRHCSARAMIEDDNSASVDDLDERCVLVASSSPMSDVDAPHGDDDDDDDDDDALLQFDVGGDRCSFSIDKLGE